jgi:hypothetical protein
MSCRPAASIDGTDPYGGDMAQSDQDTTTGTRTDLDRAVWTAPHLIWVDLSRTAASESGPGDDSSFSTS